MTAAIQIRIQSPLLDEKTGRQLCVRGGERAEASEVQAAGDDALPDVCPEPQAEVTADVEVVGYVIADDPQRDHDLGVPGPERPGVLTVNQGAEDLGAVGLAVLGTQHHAVRPGTELRARIAALVRSDKGLELETLHVRHHRSLEHTNRNTILTARCRLLGRWPGIKSRADSG